MSGTKLLGIVLLVGGILGLLYGHFDYTKETHKGNIGPFTFSIAEYTNGRFVEHELHDERWDGFLQCFDNSVEQNNA